MAKPTAASSSLWSIDEVLQPGAVVPAFQPIVDLHTGHVRAYEALARWPHCGGVSPDAAFTKATEAGRVVELDWMCRVAALETARAARLADEMAVFINVEPASLYSPAPELLVRRWNRGIVTARVVFELTERSLLAYPGDVLRFVEQARAAGAGIALDDVGADPDSLAMLDLVAPDIIKLDLRLVQETPAREQARTLAAVLAHKERTGAALLAEGIETDAHRLQALAFGADLGQGWLFGRPAALPPEPTRAPDPLPWRPLPPPVAPTPFDVARRNLPIQTASKDLLLGLSRHLEELATDTVDTPMVLAALQTANRFSAVTAHRYTHMASIAPLVAIFGVGVNVTPAPGVRGVALASTEPLSREWTVVVLGARTAAALIASDCGDTGSDAHRRFHFAVTHDRMLVTQAARSLLDRLVADPASTALASEPVD